MVITGTTTLDTTTTEDTTTVGEDAEETGTTTTGAEAAAEDTTGAEDTRTPGVGAEVATTIPGGTQIIGVITTTADLHAPMTRDASAWHPLPLQTKSSSGGGPTLGTDPGTTTADVTGTSARDPALHPGTVARERAQRTTHPQGREISRASALPA